MTPVKALLILLSIASVALAQDTEGNLIGLHSAQ